jgi:hypothetical protein
MIGLPMLSGFVGEFIILSSTFAGVSRPWAVAAALGVILGAVYMLSLVQRLFYGPESALTASKPAADLRFGELAILTPLVVLMLVMGLAPSSGSTPSAPVFIRRKTFVRSKSNSTFDARRPGANPAPFPRRPSGESSSRHLPHPPRGHPRAHRRRHHAHRRLAPARVAAPPARLGRRHRNHDRPLGQPWQLSLPEGAGFYSTVETSAFTVFFHVLICGIVLVALLLSLDTLPEDTHHQGEFYALIVFGAVGMCLLTSRRRAARRLHRPRNLLHLHLHSCRLAQAHRPRP